MRSTKILSLLLVLMYFLSCQEPKQSTDFDLEGSSTIRIINQTNDSLRIEIENWTIVPFEAQTLDTSLATSEALTYSLKAQGKKHYNLVLSQTKYRLFTQPQASDTVIINNSTKTDRLVFAGHSQPINYFLLEKQIAFGSADADWMPRTNITRQAKNFSELAKGNDSITQLHRDFLVRHGSKLPAEYVAFETDRLKYLNAGFTTNSSLYRKIFLNRSDTLPADFLDNLGEIQQPNMLGSHWYYQFLTDYIGLKADLNSLPPPLSKEARQQRSDSTYAAVQRELTGQVKDVYLAARIGQTIARRRHAVDTSRIRLVQDEALQNYLYDYLAARPVLPPGADVPYFFLPAADGEYYEPKSFQNQVVLINFWATWCKPCFREFPHENALVDEFAAEPMKIVNICIDSEPEKWREVIEKHGLKTLNLIAQENWNDVLSEKFDIDALPHSVLINANGKIVGNKCPRASEGIDEQIAELLDN